MPIEWSVEEGSKDVKWAADLGSKAYGGPVIAGGKVFVGTNNMKPRDKKYTKDGQPIDMGVIMAFDEPDGKFLWQNAYFKLAAGRVQDWPREGICSTPIVEGDRMYYVDNRCEVVCADCASGKEIWKLDMIKDLGVFPHNLAVCSPLVVGNHLFVVTSNGVDEGHINVPAPKAPSFIKLDKTNGKVLWQGQLAHRPPDRSAQARRSGILFQAPRQPRRAHSARPMVQPRLRQSQWPGAGHFPRRRRQDSFVRPRHRQAAVDLRLQSQGRTL